MNGDKSAGGEEERGEQVEEETQASTTHIYPRVGATHTRTHAHTYTPPITAVQFHSGNTYGASTLLGILHNCVKYLHMHMCVRATVKLCKRDNAIYCTVA